MTNTAINTAENSTEVSPAVQTQTEDTNVDPAQPEATTKKRSTSSAKAKANEDAAKTDAPEEVKAETVLETASSADNQEQGPAEVNTKVEAPEEIKTPAAPEMPANTDNQEQAPAEVKTNSEAPEEIKKPSEDVKATHPPEAFLTHLNSKRKLEVKNNGPRSFEIYTNTPLPAGQTVILELENDRIYRMVVSKFSQLNKLAGKERYTVKEV
ncbi:hypothetical protein [Acinetobacter calcoaceticus]|uniref:hypothetical protein n=1 Tax=Acinetobacter calcoaceticus TaxID=471 RepID=UPI00300A241C